MTAEQATQLAKKAARKNGYKVEYLPGRGKGSHHIYAVLDADGNEVGRFGLTDHGSKDVSWKVLREVESALAGLFEDTRWMEKR